MAEREQLERLLVGELDRIDRLVTALCRRHGFGADERDDFASWAKLRLVEDDYAILRKFRGESSLTTYLAVVLAMLLRDYRVHRFGRWRPSAEARRRGPLAVRLETLVRRDGLPLAQAAERLRVAGFTTLSDRALADLLAALPSRSPLRPTPMESTVLDTIASADGPEDALLGAESEAERASTDALIQEMLHELPVEDRTIVRLRYWEGLSVAEVSRALGLPQKPLYRRLERVLRSLQARLVAAGLSVERVRARLGDDDTAQTRNTHLARPSVER